jgi:outer membrane protein TolC
VQTLIDVDRVAKGEANQVVANLADRTSSRIQAEQGVLDAEQNLALAMGLTTAEITTFPQAVDSLPDWTGREIPIITPPLVQSFVERALKNRGDLLAAAEHERAAAVVIPAARNQLRPQLNLGVSVGYAGLLNGTNYLRVFASPFNNVGGPNATGSLTYSFAPRNNVARGELAQAEGVYHQAAIQRSDIERTIASNVSSAMVDLVSSIRRLQKAREAVNAYRRALDGEQDKFSLGINQFVDVLTIEDRLTNALSEALSAHLSYATAIENLRFATGTIIDINKQAQLLEKRTFLFPPFEWESN